MFQVINLVLIYTKRKYITLHEITCGCGHAPDINIIFTGRALSWSVTQAGSAVAAQAGSLHLGLSL